jgi:hypothetical protein
MHNKPGSLNNMRDTELRKQLVELLRGEQAHISFQKTVKDFPVTKAGIRPAGSPHSAWELLEHLRIAQEDIARFSGVADERLPATIGTNYPKGYEELTWPAGYWPKSPAPADASQWNKSVAGVQQDLDSFISLVEDPERNLFEPFPWGDRQTLLREALLLADHNAYHVGQLVLVRRMLE